MREALKEVSLEHNNAMIEQKKLFQKEIEALCKALEQCTDVSQETEEVAAAAINIDDKDVQFADSSNDEASLKQSSPTPSNTSSKSAKSIAIHQRSKCSKFCVTRARGGPSSSTSGINE